MNRLTTVLAGSALLISCSGDSVAPTRADEALSSAIDLISPATCQSSNNRLLKCAIQSVPLDFISFETAVPLRTKFSTAQSGNCSTQFPLAVKLQVDFEPEVSFQYIASQASQSVRRKDGQAISKIQLSDGSSWTKIASFDQTCRISLSISPN